MMSDMNREIKQQAKIMAAGARLHGLLVDLCFFSWGSRPRLYAERLLRRLKTDFKSLLDN